LWPEGFFKKRPKICGQDGIARKTDAPGGIALIKEPGHHMKTTSSTDRRGDRPNGLNRRKHPRVSIDNLISVVSVDEDGNQISQSMGRALNVSQTGIQVETPHPVKPFDAGRVSLVTVDRKAKLVKTNGKIVYSCRSDTGMFTTGIQLSGLDTVKKRFVVSLIRQYSYSSPSSRVKIAAA
jgi:hypothetical protein